MNSSQGSPDQKHDVNGMDANPLIRDAPHEAVADATPEVAPAQSGCMGCCKVCWPVPEEPKPRPACLLVEPVVDAPESCLGSCASRRRFRDLLRC